MAYNEVDLNTLMQHIRSPVAWINWHENERQKERHLPDFNTIKLSIIRGYEVVEFQRHMRVLLLSRLDDGRPLHSVWQCDGINPSFIVTAWFPTLSDWMPDWKTRRRKP